MKGQGKGKRKPTEYIRIEGRGEIQSGKQMMSEVDCEYEMSTQIFRDLIKEVEVVTEQKYLG